MTPPTIERRSSSAATVASLLLVITLLPALLACTGDPAEVDRQSLPAQPSPAAEDLFTENWRCRNDLEVRCAEGACEAETEGGFTPMAVHADDSGAMSVCAYTGCWEGTGEVYQGKRFLVWVGYDLEFSTSPGPESKADIALVIDRADGVATIKAGEFAHPLRCKRLERGP